MTKKIFKVDGILLQALLQSPTDREFLLSLESQIITHIFQNLPVAKANQGTLEFPPLNSYHRMLVHRTARYYSLKHWVVGGEDGGRPRVLLWVEVPTQMPLLKLSELIEPEIQPKSTSTLKTKETSTTSTATSTVATTTPSVAPTSSNSERKLKIMKRPKDAPPPKEAKEDVREPIKSLKEREAEYEEVRKRLFADVPSDPEEYPEAPTSTTPEQCNGSSYFDYQYHVPFYPSYYHSQQQKATTAQPPVINEPSPTCITQAPTEQVVQRTKYVEDLNKIPLPRHILSIAIGYNSTTQKRLTESKIILREDDDNLLAIFPDSELAQAALKNGLGNFFFLIIYFSECDVCALDT